MKDSIDLVETVNSPVHEIVGPNQYQCAQCGGIFDTEWTEEEARREQEENGWGGIPDSDMVVVCEDCYQVIQTRLHSTSGA